MVAALPPVPSLSLAAGAGVVEIPLIGFGTYKLTGRSGYDAVRHTLEVGYRHLDTATMYGNEDQVGRAVRDSGLERDEVFITTKLWPDDVRRARPTIARSLRALGTDHLDLWLIHWPPAGRADVPAWQDLISARDDELTRAVGVSNHTLDQIDELEAATGERPAVNQIEWGPSRFDPAALVGHRDRGTALEGYSPFKSTARDDATLVRVAAAHDVTVEQVVIRWHLQHEVIAIPKSSRPERIEANLDVFGFVLDHAEMTAIDALGRTR